MKPLLASRSAAAAPMPSDAPVTMATLLVFSLKLNLFHAAGERYADASVAYFAAMPAARLTFDERQQIGIASPPPACRQTE
jgi:hypothetical protein